MVLSASFGRNTDDITMGLFWPMYFQLEKNTQRLYYRSLWTDLYVIPNGVGSGQLKNKEYDSIEHSYVKYNMFVAPKESGIIWASINQEKFTLQNDV